MDADVIQNSAQICPNLKDRRSTDFTKQEKTEFLLKKRLRSLFHSKSPCLHFKANVSGNSGSLEISSSFFLVSVADKIPLAPSADKPLRNRRQNLGIKRPSLQCSSTLIVSIIYGEIKDALFVSIPLTMLYFDRIVIFSRHQCSG